MKKIFLSALTLLIGLLTQAQITKTNIVEHFTNSNCSICANQNPGIYSTLGSNPNVLHITFHPSSPYASCVFSMANPTENDARTNFYNIYGGTPRLVVNGNVITTANLSSTLTNLNTSLTNYQVYATQELITSDSILVNVVIKKIASDTMTQALLFVGAKQDTVIQTTGNGESIHQDVFRKGLTNMNGNNINLPSNINDSTLFTFSYSVEPTWTASRMQTIVIVQDLNKQVINSAESTNIQSIPTTVQENTFEELKVYPNPSSENIIIQSNNQYTTYKIFSLQGKLIANGNLINNQISLTQISNGIYFLKLVSNGNSIILKIQIQK